MKNASVKVWLLSSLLGDQEDTGFYLLMFTFRTCFEGYGLRWGFGECQSEVKRGVQGRQNVRDDVHLVNPFHQEVEVSIVSPFFLGEVPINRFGHVRQAVSEVPANFWTINLALNLKDREFFLQTLNELGIRVR